MSFHDVIGGLLQVNIGGKIDQHNLLEALDTKEMLKTVTFGADKIFSSKHIHPTSDELDAVIDRTLDNTVAAGGELSFVLITG